jgi:hypothetical protein
MTARMLVSGWLTTALLGCTPASDTPETNRDAATRPVDTAAATTGGAAGGDEAKIRDAVSAAPASISGNATVMDWPAGEGEQMRQLRPGSNDWLCFPSSPAAVTAAGQDPMCFPKTMQGWAEAWMTKKQPKLTRMDIAYMLRGDAGVSNTDPFATAPAPDNSWVKSGPHVMVMVPNPKELDALPTDPAGGGPWVMWKGTPYAHLMVPVQ